MLTRSAKPDPQHGCYRLVHAYIEFNKFMYAYLQIHMSGWDVHALYKHTYSYIRVHGFIQSRSITSKYKFLSDHLYVWHIMLRRSHKKHNEFWSIGQQRINTWDDDSPPRPSYRVFTIQCNFTSILKKKKKWIGWKAHQFLVKYRSKWAHWN